MTFYHYYHQFIFPSSKPQQDIPVPLKPGLTDIRIATFRPNKLFKKGNFGRRGKTVVYGKTNQLSKFKSIKQQ
ncbi:hypothetical protein ASF92_09195 [Pedobacter sp. Leaf176]|nr:hypothetical protein ASF92_09195 [Pedobacter sp. Leaf176]